MRNLGLLAATSIGRNLPDLLIEGKPLNFAVDEMIKGMLVFMEGCPDVEFDAYDDAIKALRTGANVGAVLRELKTRLDARDVVEVYETLVTLGREGRAGLGIPLSVDVTSA